jgi:hypothetical protein
VASSSPADVLEVQAMGRFAEPARWILVALDAGPRTLTSVFDDVRRLDGRIGHGTLLGAVARLERQGLIEPLAGGRARPAYRSTRTMETTP